VPKVKYHQITILLPTTDCSAISLSDFTYYLGERTVIPLSACISSHSTTGTLKPMNTETPSNIAFIEKNENYSFSLIIMTNDSSIINK
jgi:hypothetical protein